MHYGCSIQDQRQGQHLRWGGCECGCYLRGWIGYAWVNGQLLGHRDVGAGTGLGKGGGGGCNVGLMVLGFSVVSGSSTVSGPGAAVA
jgi:hypothetical protein